MDYVGELASKPHVAVFGAGISTALRFARTLASESAWYGIILLYEAHNVSTNRAFKENQKLSTAAPRAASTARKTNGRTNDRKKSKNTNTTVTTTATNTTSGEQQQQQQQQQHACTVPYNTIRFLQHRSSPKYSISPETNPIPWLARRRRLSRGSRRAGTRWRAAFSPRPRCPSSSRPRRWYRPPAHRKRRR